uniref:Alanyl-transfer RNA synthetases family profile domain-containing protein n=1 Tax=Ciona savignyi TaxID=51511 RepID=H2Y6A8_CIOSA
MVFKCQSDSYLKRFESKVVSCVEAEWKIENEGGKLVKTKGYEVELEDTILFPEGGGQPHDRGSINDVPVKKVIQKGGKALHFLDSAVEVGYTVSMDVEWTRRFDHMQQHSAQHLVTAIADTLYGFKTTSWDLGRTTSFIELDTPALTSEQLLNIENSANKSIREGVEVVVHVTQVGSPMLQSVRARGLPEDHTGDVRIIEMKGIDANMCCGTHVSNLSHLQCIKLLMSEKGKKGKTNLYFLAGNRVLGYTEKCHASERELTKHLKCGPDQHVEAVERTMKQLKVAQKNCTTLLRDVAMLETQQFNVKFKSGSTKLMEMHKKEGNVEFMNIISNGLDEQAFRFLSVGEEKGEGMILIAGPGSFVEECGPKLMEILAAKGHAKNGKIQGKAQKLQNREKALLIVRDYIEKL